MVSTTTNSIVTGYPAVPFDLPNEKLHRRLLAEAVNRLNRAKFNAVVDVTLNANTGATLITDNRIGHTSAVSPLMALSLSAGVAVAAGIWFDNPLSGGGTTTGSIIVHHNITADVDKKIRFGIIG